MTQDVQGTLFKRSHPHHTKVEFDRIKATVASLLSQGHDRHRVASALNDLGFKKASSAPIDADYVSQVRYKLEKEGFPWNAQRLPADGRETEEFWKPTALQFVVFLAALATAIGYAFKGAH